MAAFARRPQHQKTPLKGAASQIRLWGPCASGYSRKCSFRVFSSPSSPVGSCSTLNLQNASAASDVRTRSGFVSSWQQLPDDVGDGFGGLGGGGLLRA